MKNITRALQRTICEQELKLIVPPADSTISEMEQRDESRSNMRCALHGWSGIWLRHGLAWQRDAPAQ